jgi:hypothetical protein
MVVPQSSLFLGKTISITSPGKNGQKLTFKRLRIEIDIGKSYIIADPLPFLALIHIALFPGVMLRAFKMTAGQDDLRF